MDRGAPAREWNCSSRRSEGSPTSSVTNADVAGSKRRNSHPGDDCRRSWMKPIEQWFWILQRERVGVADFVGLADLEAKIAAFTSEWNVACACVDVSMRAVCMSAGNASKKPRIPSSGQLARSTRFSRPSMSRSRRSPRPHRRQRSRGTRSRVSAKREQAPLPACGERRVRGRQLRRAGTEHERMTDHRLRAFCRQLRRDSTDAERALWRRLRARRIGAKFRRQHALGPFIADFYCAAARLVVELDGGQHFESRGELDDARRTRWLDERGIRVLRFTNTEALREPDAVVDAIAAALA